MTQNDATTSKSATKARPTAPPGEGWGEGIGRLGALGWSVQGGPHCGILGFEQLAECHRQLWAFEVVGQTAGQFGERRRE